ncbi:PQQ-binding-like beta-propeller repeat protein [Ruania halotolerans]|uniref:outer membrane protein assembly factor BamB family protein n=1 Tax=Ruania halotolerans TaxID=2897773 RepID=UPI001E5DDE4D|nr:PQQ-binding-like beta-propeller repeat protein [Ruania halotolerans]UFU05862.1 PQQ-binding-like beta-propeller repeat protein [Ruania halotolerans]
MGTGQVEDFILDSEPAAAGHRGPGGGEAERPDASARRRSARRWRRSPWPWAAVAVVLVAAGALVSPRGERSPETAWAVDLETGSAAGAWLVDDRIMATTAAGLIALDPADGAEIWTLPLDDPTCTSEGGTLTCVDGEGQDATITTVDKGGIRSTLPMPDAQVATTVGSDLIVAGIADGRHWLGRYDAEGSQRWKEAVEVVSTDNTWRNIEVQNGVVIAHASGSLRVTSGVVVPLALHLDTGEPATMTFPGPGGLSSTGNVSDARSEHREIAPRHHPVWLSLAQLNMPEYPDALVTLGAVRANPSGNDVMTFDGAPLAAVGSTVYTTDVAHDRTDLLAYDVADGDLLWSAPLPGRTAAICPCAASDQYLLLVTAEHPIDDALPAHVVRPSVRSPPGSSQRLATPACVGCRRLPVLRTHRRSPDYLRADPLRPFLSEHAPRSFSAAGPFRPTGEPAHLAYDGWSRCPAGLPPQRTDAKHDFSGGDDDEHHRQRRAHHRGT